MPARQSADTLNVVDVLRQLPVDVLNRSFWPALNEKDLRSFREAGPAARNLIHQTKATVFIAAMSAGPYDLANVELRARLLQKYSACTDVSIAVESPGDVSCVLVRYPYGLIQVIEACIAVDAALQCSYRHRLNRKRVAASLACNFVFCKFTRMSVRESHRVYNAYSTSGPSHHACR